jgi:hypothetical protein
MKKQTAVEWLYEEIISTPLDANSLRQILEIAKYKERDQIAEAHREGAWFYAVKTYESGHNYYEETYGKK